MTAASIAHPARAVVAALVVLALGWLLAPRFAPPVYDGVGFPDEPYRFVVAPSDAKTHKAPTTATDQVPVTKGTAAAAVLNSAEQAPQVSVLIPTGRLQAPAGATRIALHAKPIPPMAAPSGDSLWSNVYDVGADDPKVALHDSSPPATITLRAASAQRPYPKIERYAGGRWTPVKTVPVGQDIYQATLPALGDYAVVGTSPLVVGAKAGSSTTSRSGVIIFVGAVVVVLGLIVIGVVRRRRRTEEPV
ncbi:MAG TPA: hypothetical protein VIG48_10235 [Jatrophihabitans sp.]|jgi:hypothetical protein